MKKVRLLQLDGKFVNIALMKISTFYKRKGYDVGWYMPVLDFEDTDYLFVSKIFKFTPDYRYFPENTRIFKGGSGYNLKLKLPKDIESITELDYSLYPSCDYSLQFYSRGCTKKCKFCIVPQKEGYIKDVTPFKLNPKSKYIEVLDNNFFASPNWRRSIQDLIKTGLPVHFHGIELYTITKEVAYYLNKVKRHKYFMFAWDNPKARPQTKIKEVLQWIKPYKFMCYVLIGFNSTELEDLYRVEELRKLGIDPYVMPYDKTDVYQSRFTRWVNHKAIFKSVKWVDYK